MDNYNTDYKKSKDKNTYNNIKQKADINKIKNALDSQLRQMQQDKVKELVAFHLALAKEREIYYLTKRYLRIFEI